MSDIQAGDVVVCVDDAPPKWESGFVENASIDRLVLSAYYRVEATQRDARLGTRLGVKLRHVSGGWFAARFRKIRPADPEFIALVKRVKEPA